MPQRVRSKRLRHGIPENRNGLIRSMAILPASENPMPCTVPGRKKQEAPYDPVFILDFQAYRCVDAWSVHAGAHSKTVVTIVFFLPLPQDRAYPENREIVPFGSEN